MSKIVEIYTDGACRGNPGPGGWGAILKYGNAEKTISGAEQHTTNNRMELMAAIMALRSLSRPCHVKVTTDSQYVRQGITEWIHNWKVKNWRTSNREPVKNADLWQMLDSETTRHHIEWHWVKGHNGHPENEMADYLATTAIDSLLADTQK